MDDDELNKLELNTLVTDSSRRWKEITGYMTANGWHVGLNLLGEVAFYQYDDFGGIVCDGDVAEEYWLERDKYPFGPPRF